MNLGVPNWPLGLCNLRPPNGLGFRDAIGTSCFAARVSVGLRILGKDLPARIPAKRPANPHSDIGDVTSYRALLLTAHIGNRSAPLPHTVEEVAHMVNSGLQLASTLRPGKIVKVVKDKFFPR